MIRQRELWIATLALVLALLLARAAMVHGQAGMGCDPQVIDPSGVVHDLAWLQGRYPGIKCVPVTDTSRDYFALVKVVYKSDPAANMVMYVRGLDGSPQIGQPTTYWYPSMGSPSPDLGQVPGQFMTRCSPRGVLNKNTTDGNGMVSYEWGSSSWINNGRGPYGAQVLSVSANSACYDGFGWDPYTEHQGYVMLVWQLMHPTQLSTPTYTPAPPTSTSVPKTPTPTVFISPIPTPGPGIGDLAETNDLLRQIIALLKEGFRLH